MSLYTVNSSSILLLILLVVVLKLASQVGQQTKNLPANAGDTGDAFSIPGSGRSPGEGNGNPLQYSRLGNPMDRGGWQAAVCRVTELDMTERLSVHAGCKVEVQKGKFIVYFCVSSLG